MQLDLEPKINRREMRWITDGRVCLSYRQQEHLDRHSRSLSLSPSEQASMMSAGRCSHCCLLRLPTNKTFQRLNINIEEVDELTSTAPVAANRVAKSLAVVHWTNVPGLLSRGMAAQLRQSRKWLRPYRAKRVQFTSFLEHKLARATCHSHIVRICRLRI